MHEGTEKSGLRWTIDELAGDDILMAAFSALAEKMYNAQKSKKEE